MVFRRKGRPTWYFDLTIAGEYVGRFSTYTTNRATARAMSGAIRELGLAGYMDLVRQLQAGKLTAPALYQAKLEGRLDALRVEADDPPLADAIAAFRAAVTDDRVRYGLALLAQLAPRGARLSYLTSAKNVTALLAMAAEDREPGTVRRTLYRAVADLLTHELGRGRRMLVMADVRAPRQQPARDVRLTPEQVRAVVDAADEQFRLLVLAAMLTGVDQGPLLRALAKDYHEDRGTLLVRDRKSHARPRVLELSEPAQTVFRVATSGLAPEERVFAYTRWQVRKRWDAVREAAKVPECRFKDLRHVFATAAEEAGASIKDVQILLGHTTSKTTLDYLGARPSRHRAVMDDVARVLGLDQWNRQVREGGGA